MIQGGLEFLLSLGRGNVVLLLRHDMMGTHLMGFILKMDIGHIKMLDARCMKMKKCLLLEAMIKERETTGPINKTNARGSMKGLLFTEAMIVTKCPMKGQMMQIHLGVIGWTH